MKQSLENHMHPKVWIKEKAPKAKDVNLQAGKHRESEAANLWS